MGRLDIVISNSGWVKFVDFADLDQNADEGVRDRYFSVNVKSHLFLLYAAREHLQKANGVFVMISSVAGVKPNGGASIVGGSARTSRHIQSPRPPSAFPKLW